VKRDSKDEVLYRSVDFRSHRLWRCCLKASRSSLPLLQELPQFLTKISLLLGFSQRSSRQLLLHWKFHEDLRLAYWMLLSSGHTTEKLNSHMKLTWIKRRWTERDEQNHFLLFFGFDSWWLLMTFNRQALFTFWFVYDSFWSPLLTFWSSPDGRGYYSGYDSRKIHSK
jgi:hypothetical protein